jgi:GntR family transcriptional repressor for pyruvate dehydrogenase complex
VGDKLPSEFELCNQFGVSRTAIREALRLLSAQGLLTIIKGKGIFVAGISVDTVTKPLHFYLLSQSERNYVLDIVHARQLIEPEIAAAAAEARTQEDMEKLQADINTMIQSEGDYEELARLDMQFHLDLAKASHNTLMPLIVDPIHRLMPNIKSSVYATVLEAKTSAVEYHQKILQAVKSGNPGRARTAMIKHLKIAEQHAEIMLKSQSTTDKQNS